jgi:hypothetical protein
MVMKHRGLRVRWSLMVVAVAGSYGLLASFIPSPHSAEVFWVGNTVAPWLMLAYWAGDRANSLVSGALMGAIADISAVVSFYARGFADAPPALFMYRWMIVAACVGTGVGALGAYRRWSASTWPLLALAAAVAIEPLWWTAVRGYDLPSSAVWMVHVIVAAAIAAYSRSAGSAGVSTAHDMAA